LGTPNLTPSRSVGNPRSAAEIGSVHNFLDSPARTLYILVQERVSSSHFSSRTGQEKEHSMKKKPKKDDKKGPKKGK